MAEVKFYLEKRKNKSTGEYLVKNIPIILVYSFNGQRLFYFTGFRTDEQKWDSVSMKVGKGYADASEINRELSKLKAKVEDIHSKANALNEKISIAYFKEKLNGEKSTIEVDKKTFSNYLEEYYNSSKLQKGEGTMRSIKSTFNIFKKFSEHEKIKLEFKNITQDFYDRFLNYCFNEMDYKNGYTGKLIKDLKAFLNWATERGYNQYFDYKKKSFKKLTEEPEIIYLTYDELMLLYKHKVKGIVRLQQVRDVFCFACFTGMRYSDLCELKPAHIVEDFIRYRVVKTSKSNMIPLNKFSKAILEKYKGESVDRCLPMISEQNTNEYLKELFKIIKLNRKVEKVSYQGAKPIKLIAPLSEVITFHISKKTFMTNFLAKGGSLLTAMAITGNIDFKAAKRYYKVVDSLKQAEMKKVFG